MKLRCLIGVVILAGATACAAQDRSPGAYADLISPELLREYLTILASDALEGRETGSRGQKMAAAFIRHHFSEWGLTGPAGGSYYQPLELYQNVPGEVYMQAGAHRFRNFEDIVYMGMDDSGGEISLPVVFGGNGRAAELNGLELTEKAVLFFVGPGDDYRAAMSQARLKKARMVLVVNTKDVGEFRSFGGRMRTQAFESRPSLKKIPRASKSEGMFFVSPEVAAAIFQTTPGQLMAAAENAAGRSKIKAGTIRFRTSVDVNVIHSENVLGFIEGTDKKDEVLVITAHYDHIGMETGGAGDRINNGADDDGSGTVAIMEIARAFAQARKEGRGPRRSILFMLVTAEEKGLLGSQYYTQHPVFPLEQTVVNLNLDMVGRRDEQHAESTPYVYVIGSDKLSTELHRINESMNRKYTNLIFDYTYNDEDHPARLYYRSDHWNFAQKNIPIIFFFDGIHEDYHQPSDEVGKIEFDLLALRAKLIFHTAWEIANRSERITNDVKKN